MLWFVFCKFDFFACFCKLKTGVELIKHFHIYLTDSGCYEILWPGCSFICFLVLIMAIMKSHLQATWSKWTENPVRTCSVRIQAHGPVLGVVFWRSWKVLEKPRKRVPYFFSWAVDYFELIGKLYSPKIDRPIARGDSFVKVGIIVSMQSFCLSNESFRTTDAKTSLSTRIKLLSKKRLLGRLTVWTLEWTLPTDFTSYHTAWRSAAKHREIMITLH